MVVDRLRNRRQRNGTSGKYLVGFGLVVLTIGLFTDTLGRQVTLGRHPVTLLEVGVGVLGLALGRLLVHALVRKLKRGLLKGLLAGVTLGVALPAMPTLGVALPAVPFAGQVARRVPTARIARHVPGLGVSRRTRLRRAVGGVRGVGAGGVGATLVTYGAQTGSLDETYVVFGTRVELLTLFLLLSVPGALVYAIRNW